MRSVSFIPLTRVPLRILNVGASLDSGEHQTVGEPTQRLQRPVDIEEQDDTRPIAVIPRLVLEVVVEHNALALLPPEDTVADADTTDVRAAGDDEAKMNTDEAIRRAAVPLN